MAQEASCEASIYTYTEGPRAAAPAAVLCLKMEERILGRITAIEGQRARDRVNIFVDGKYAFSLRSSLASGLAEGAVLLKEEAERLLREESFSWAYDRALNQLSRRPRSREEIKRYLRNKKVSEPVVEAVVDKLTTAGFLDDFAFARYWVENRERFRPRGVAILRYELRLKGVDDEAISEAVDEVNEVASAVCAATRQAPRYARLDEDSFRHSMGQFLRRRGFSYNIIREVVNLLMAQTTREGG